MFGVSISSEGRPRGRPRSRGTEAAVLQATWELLKDTQVCDLTIEAISMRSGVSRPTIYRWWQSKNAIVVDAVFDQVRGKVRYNEAGSAAMALTRQLEKVISLLRGRPGRIVAELLAEGQGDPETLASLNRRFLETRREDALALVERGRATGEFASSVDAKLAIDLIYGPLYYRLMAQHEPLSKSLARELVQLAMQGLAPR